MISKNKIKALKALQQKKFRDSENKYIVEGKKISEEAFTYKPGLIEEIICTDDMNDIIPTNLSAKTSIASIEDIKKISSLKTPQKILAVLNKPSRSELDFSTIDELILALDSIRDPGNMGTIIRLADWFGVKNIICSLDCVDSFNPKSIQASMGAILRMNIHYTDLIPVIKNASTYDYAIYGATLDGNDLYKSDIKNRALLVMGNESEGISQNVRNVLTNKLFIPNYSSNSEKTESLNVSIATSVLLSEFRRVLHYSK